MKFSEEKTGETILRRASQKSDGEGIQDMNEQERISFIQSLLLTELEELNKKLENHLIEDHLTFRANDKLNI